MFLLPSLTRKRTSAPPPSPRPATKGSPCKVPNEVEEEEDFPTPSTTASSISERSSLPPVLDTVSPLDYLSRPGKVIFNIPSPLPSFSSPSLSHLRPSPLRNNNSSQNLLCLFQAPPTSVASLRSPSPLASKSLEISARSEKDVLGVLAAVVFMFDERVTGTVAVLKGAEEAVARMYVQARRTCRQIK